MNAVRRRLAVAACLALLLPAAQPAAADPPSWSGVLPLHERYHRPDDGESGPVLFAGEGAGEAGEAAVARGLPWGFNRGTCDRALLEAATGASLPVRGALGRLMDQGDRECLWGALESLPDNRSIAWLGDSGALFRVSTERTYMRAGAPCRDWRAKAVHPAGQSQTSGTFCRRSDGQWVAAN